MSLQTYMRRLAKLEAAIKAEEGGEISEAEREALIAESLLRSKGAVHYVLTHPNGCFQPPVGIGRTIEEITLEEVVEFENCPWAAIDDLDRRVAQFMLGAERDQAAFDVRGHDLKTG